MNDDISYQLLGICPDCGFVIVRNWHGDTQCDGGCFYKVNPLEAVDEDGFIIDEDLELLFGRL